MKPSSKKTNPLSPPNPLVALLGDKKIWINWTLEPAKNTDDSPKLLPNGSPKYTKIPRRLSGSFASVSDPGSWSTFAEADAALNNGGNFSGVGIVFEDSLRLVGIDLDHYIVNNELKHDEVLAFLIEADTYAEKSPSGTGLHIFFQTEDVFDPITKKHHDESDANLVTEIYSRGRYFTFTGDVYGEPKDVRAVSVEELNRILGILGYPWGKEKTEILASTVKPNNYFAATDAFILDKMFSAKNGDQIRALYNGDLSAYGGDHSSADMAFCLHASFWTAKDAAAIERIWKSSPLGSREKTQKRKDYVDRTIANAIKNTKETYVPPSPQSPQSPQSSEEGEEDPAAAHFVRNKKGRAELITGNIVEVFEHNPKFQNLFRLNSFSNMIECRTEFGSWINMVDRYVLNAQTKISKTYPDFVKLARSMTEDAIKLSAALHAVNPPVDWIRSLTWDGTPRLDHWLYKVYGTPDDDLHQSMGANFLKGMAQRITSPGCQMDLVLCLEGAQGTRKSSSLRVLGGDWFAENVTTVDSKDDLILFAGNILVEFSEGAVLSAYSVTKLKSVITSTVDKFRPPYEHGLVSFPRGCVFSLSTNDTAYLKDETGGRRFLIVKLGRVADTKWLAENRDQLMAEALHRIEAGETAYEFSEVAEEELRELQESRTAESAYEDVVVDWYLGRSAEAQDAGFTTLDVYINAIHTSGEEREMSVPMEKNIKSILKRSLYLEHKPMKRDENGKRPRRWVPTDKTRKKFKLNRDESVDGVDEFANYKSVAKDPGEE